MMGWLANLLNMIGLTLLRKKQRVGWLFGIVAECLWVIRAYEMGDARDLIFASTGYCLLAAWSYYEWRSEPVNQNGLESGK